MQKLLAKLLLQVLHKTFMQKACCFAALFAKLVCRTVIQELLRKAVSQALALGRFWRRCFLSFPAELSCKCGFAKSFLKVLPAGFAETLARHAVSSAFKMDCRGEVALQSCCCCFREGLTCTSWCAKLFSKPLRRNVVLVANMFLKQLRRTVVQKPLCQNVP